MEAGTQQRIRSLAASHAGPFYRYDLATIRAQCRRFVALPYEPKLVCHATMANAHPIFLRTVLEEGLGVFVNSPGHLDVALKQGFKAGNTVFTASAMDEPLLRRVQGLGLILNLDSLGQLQLWRRLFPQQPVGIRCNIGGLVAPCATRGGLYLGTGSRLGLDVAEIEALAGSTAIRGLHLYLGTDLHELSYFQECYEQIVRLADLFPALDYLDFGGGFGAPSAQGQAFDLEAYGRWVSPLMAALSARLGRSIQLILEPGRIIGAEAGHFVCRVTDVKQRDGRQLVGVNASSAQFTRPLLYPDDSWHPVALLPAKGRVPGQPVSSAVYGCSTYSRDFLARELPLPSARPGDLLAFGQAGSYCASAYTRFLGFEPAAELFE